MSPHEAMPEELLVPARTKAVIIGQGYVGLPLSMRAVEVGYDVVGYDLDLNKIESLRAGRSYIDDVTDEELAVALASGRYNPTDIQSDIKEFDVAVISVPTPLEEGVPDISFIRSAAEVVGEELTPGSTVILESTTYPGTTEEVVAPILEDVSGLTAGRHFHLGYSPERIDPGNEVWGFQQTPKVVSGIDAASLARVQAFFDRLVDQTVPIKGTREAELTKLVENTFRHVNIALVNELAMHARALEIDFGAVIEAAATKPFGFMPFYPGPGVGGHCLPVDPSYMSWIFEQRLNSVSRFVKIANEVNNNMPNYVANRVQAGLNKRMMPVNGSSVVILGIAYKKNSNDARETPASGLIRSLHSLGAKISVVDAHVERYALDHLVSRVDAVTPELLQEANVVVIVTDHDDVDYDMVLEHSKYVFDSRRRLPEWSTVEYL